MPSGGSLRLRIHPRPATERAGKAGAGRSLPLFPEAGGVSRSEMLVDRLARQVVQLCLMNPINVALIERFATFGIQDWWLTAGCLAQTVWNLRTGRPPGHGIKDYDIFYYADDLSEEAENEVIAKAAAEFADLGVKVDVRNQARVHVWYPKKFGVAYPPLAGASEGILRFPSRTLAIGLKRTGDEFIDLFAPFGLENVWNMVIAPNRSLPIPHIYAEKAERWRKSWPTLTVHAWAEEGA